MTAVWNDLAQRWLALLVVILVIALILLIRKWLYNWLHYSERELKRVNRIQELWRERGCLLYDAERAYLDTDRLMLQDRLSEIEAELIVLGIPQESLQAK